MLFESVLRGQRFRDVGMRVKKGQRVHILHLKTSKIEPNLSKVDIGCLDMLNGKSHKKYSKNLDDCSC